MEGENELRSRIKETVLGILESADMQEMTEYKVRKLAAEKLSVDLSAPDHKRFVRQVVESFLKDQQAKASAEEEKKEVEEEEEEEGEDGKRRSDGKEYDDEGDLIICRLSSKRRVTITDFRGKTLVSIREYYYKDGKELPTSKGISLTAEQWSSFSKNVPEIEKAIEKVEGR